MIRAKDAPKLIPRFGRIRIESKYPASAGGVLDAGLIGFAEPGVYLKPAGGFRIEDRGEAIPGA